MIIRVIRTNLSTISCIYFRIIVYILTKLFRLLQLLLLFIQKLLLLVLYLLLLLLLLLLV